MSTTTTTDLRSRVNALNEMILEGQILEAFDKFYSEDIVMEEDGEKREGWEANREYEEQFVDSLEEFRDAEVKSVAVDPKNDVTMVEWYFDFTLEDVGDVELNQVAVQYWEDGEIVNEKFYKIG